MLLPLLLATATVPSAPTPRIVPDVLRQDARIRILAEGGHLLPRQAKSLEIQMQSIERVHWQVREVDPRSWNPSFPEEGSTYGSYAEQEGLEEEEPSEDDNMTLFGVPPLEETEEGEASRKYTWSHQGRVSRPRDSLSTWSFRLNLDSLSRLHPGKLVSLKISAAPRDFLPFIDTSVCDTARVEETFLVSRLGLFGTGLGTDSAEILAVDLDKNRPWPGVALRSFGKKPKLERTGPEGTVRSAIKGSGRFWIGLAEGRELAVLSLGAIGRENWSKRLQVKTQENGPAPGPLHSGGIRTFPYLVRGVHSPGDTVVVGCLVRGAGGAIPQGHPLTLRLCDGGNCLDSIRLRVGATGHVQWRPRLSRNASTGSWKVEVQSGRERSQAKFRVEEMKPPRMKLEVIPRVVDSLRGAWGLEFTAQWLSGRPAEGSSFEARVDWSDFDSTSNTGGGDTLLRGNFDGLGRAVFSRDSSSGRSLAWKAKLIVREAGGHTVEQESRGTFRFSRLARDSSQAKSESAEKGPSRPWRHPMDPVLDAPEPRKYAFPEEVSPTDLFVGDTARVRWEAFAPGLALLQVVQGDRILRQSFRNVQRGLQTWKEAVDSAWVPQAHMVVSLLQATPSGTGWVRADAHSVDIAPRDTGFKLLLMTDSVFHPRSTASVVVRNPTKVSGTMVVSAVDEGLLMIDNHRIEDPSWWFTQPERLAVSWWDGLGRCGSPYFHEESRKCHTSEDLFGVGGGFGSRHGRMALGAGGTGKGVATRGRSARRPFLEANPMSWVSPVLPVVPGDQTVTIPLGAYTGQVRLSVVAVSGMQAIVADTNVPVRADLEMKISGPMVVAPGDTFEVLTTTLAKPGTVSSMELAVDGPVAALDSLKWTQRLEGSSRADHRTRLVAKSLGNIRVMALAAGVGDTSMVALAVEVKDDRNLSKEILQKSTKEGALTFVLDDRFLSDSLSVRLEATTRGAMGMDRRLRELIGYPHGCLEQTLSRAIPQLYLSELFPEMTPSDRERARSFVDAAVRKLNTFRNRSGLLSLWPGEQTPHEWGSLWALDFLQEYHRRFPKTDRSLMDALQKTLDTTRFEDPLQEAYRLALRSSASSGKKVSTKDLDSLSNRKLPTNARWMLARAWHRAGNPERARKLLSQVLANPDTTSWRWGMGSAARDRALALETLTELGDSKHEDSLATLVAADLASTGWATTHELGAQFRALAKALGAGTPDQDSGLQIRWGHADAKPLQLVKGRASMVVPTHWDTLQVRLPGPSRKLSVEVVRQGRLKAPMERRDSGLVLRMDSLPPRTLKEGQAFQIRMEAGNQTSQNLTDLAATLWLPGGWTVPREQRLALREGWRHVDIRADRVVFHFDLASGQSRTIRIPLVAQQAGSYREAAAQLEALYNADLFGSWKGQRVKIAR